MELVYASTRDAQERVTASQAILRGLSNDGGLFTDTDSGAGCADGRAWQNVLSGDMRSHEAFSDPDFTERFKALSIPAYDSKFDTEEIAPLVRADTYYLELFHGSRSLTQGPALLSILPYLLTAAAKKNHVKNEIVIQTATSGDTGKAALAGFSMFGNENHLYSIRRTV